MGREICDELKQNFVDFSYEANSQRAFPSALDGLKPGQRACLWEFYNKGYSFTKPHVKSAKVAGGVIGSWWPHGDVAVYETFARMSQPWINNIPEVDWHGANGSQIGGPEPASSRYTEARLSKASEDGFFGNIKKDTVDFIPNFSEDDEWPVVLPAIFPRLFVNGSQGIGMTIANVWLPGNLNELFEKVKQYVSTGDITYDNIYPDFPSGGVIINKAELEDIYTTGKGRCVLRAKATIEGNSILITELPYQVYAEPLIDSIKELVNKGQITGIKDIFNKSDKHRLLIEIECDGSPKVVLNKLYDTTELQKVYSANQYAMITKVPELLNLKQYIEAYVNHNLSCIEREYKYDLNKANARIEIVNGLLKALEDIDNIIKLIKSSESTLDAQKNLINKYSFSENQAKAILDMKLAKLAHLEAIDLQNEKKTLEDNIKNYLTFLNNKVLQKEEFINRLQEFVNKYGYTRRTEITQLEIEPKEKEEVKYVEPEQCVVIITETDYIKRVPNAMFKVQKRNTSGVKNQSDITADVIRTNTVDNLLIFTNKGKMYKLLVDKIPEGTNNGSGVSIKSLIEMEADEKVSTIYSMYRDTEAKYILFTTKQGLVKKCPLEDFTSVHKKKGIAATKINEGDELIDVSILTNEEILLLTTRGQVIRIKSDDINISSRAAKGVKGITLRENDYVIAALPIRHDTDNLAVFSTGGLGKKLSLADFNIQNRGGKGVICYKTTPSTGNLIAAALVEDNDNVLIVGSKSSLYISAKDIPLAGKNAIGNKILKTDTITSVSKA